MTTLPLFALTVLIWGTTWIAITFQIGPVDIFVSVFYRFALAGALFLAGLVLLGRLRWPATWRFVLAQAFCLFSLNFLCFYKATTLMPSGLVSVIFSLATILNALNARWIFGDAIRARVVLAGVVGAGGLVLMFWEDIAISPDWGVIQGIGWASIGTMLFSLGNMMSRKNTAHGVTPITANAWGMGIGASVLLAVILWRGVEITLPLTPSYLGALFYLSVIGSIAGFTAYLSLVARIGSDRAAYATVLFPVIALMLSSLFEGFVWQPAALVGLALTMLGNVIMFSDGLMNKLRRPSRA
jgi:drug/metabolite transporter (DMT)-like permease